MIEEVEAKRLNAIVCAALGWRVVNEPREDEPDQPWRVACPQDAEDYVFDVGEYHYTKERAERVLPDFLSWNNSVGDMQGWLIQQPGITDFSIALHKSDYYGVWGYIFRFYIDGNETEFGHGKQEVCLAQAIERVVNYREQHPFVPDELPADEDDGIGNPANL